MTNQIATDQIATDQGATGQVAKDSVDERDGSGRTGGRGGGCYLSRCYLSCCDLSCHELSRRSRPVLLGVTASGRYDGFRLGGAAGRRSVSTFGLQGATGSGTLRELFGPVFAGAEKNLAKPLRWFQEFARLADGRRTICVVLLGQFEFRQAARRGQELAFVGKSPTEVPIAAF